MGNENEYEIGKMGMETLRSYVTNFKINYLYSHSHY